MSNEIQDFLRFVVRDLIVLIAKRAPELVPEARSVVQKYRAAIAAPGGDWDNLIESVRAGKFDEIDHAIDAEIAGLNLPEK